MKKKLTMINNIVCAILLVATFATMLIPCWDFVAEEKVKVRVCRDCGTEAELEEGSTRVREGYICPGTKLVDPNEQEEEEETTDATEPAADATEPVAVDTEAEVEATEPELVEVPCGNDSSLKHYKLQEKKLTYDDSASVMEFTWFSYDNVGLTNQFVAEGIVINDIVLIPFVVTLFVIVGVIFCLVNIKGTWHSIFPLAAGLMTVSTYLGTPVFQQGSWTTTLGCAIALSVVALLLFAQSMMKVIKWFVAPVHKK